MIQFARKCRGNRVCYVEPTETGEICFDAAAGTGMGFLAAVVGLAGPIGWVASLVGFIGVRRAFSIHRCEFDQGDVEDHELVHKTEKIS